MNPPIQAGRGTPEAGAILYNGAVYDRNLQRCRVYAVADGEGGMEWRVARERWGSESHEAIERCFATYTQALEWLQ